MCGPRAPAFAATAGQFVGWTYQGSVGLASFQILDPNGNPVAGGTNVGTVVQMAATPAIGREKANTNRSPTNSASCSGKRLHSSSRCSS